MNKNFDPQEGRYLLFIDLLGFSDLVETMDVEEVYAVITEALQAFGYWEGLNKFFRTIYFSDTFIFYHEPKGYSTAGFLDVYAIGEMILSALLAKGIPARGAISFGQFEVRSDDSARHQVYFGSALIEAYRAEQKENWIGIVILKSAWSLYEQTNPGIIDAFQSERVWIKRHDDVLLLNPFIKLRGWYIPDLIGEVDKPYLQWNAPEFPNDILGFKFLREKASAYVKRVDFSGKEASKYHATIGFLKQVLGDELYQWGTRISESD